MVSMAFWKMCSFILGFLLIESVLPTSAAPRGGSENCELSLRYFERDLESRIIFFDIITKEGTALNTSLHSCELVSAQGETNAEAAGFELTVRLERPLLKVVVDKKNSVAFSPNRDQVRRIATLLCDDLEIKCIQFQGNEIGKRLEFSEVFMNRKLLSTTPRERNMADPFLTVSVATAGVVLLILVLGLCASCRGKDESVSHANADAQLVSVTTVIPMTNMPDSLVEKRESKNISAVIESGEKADSARHSSLGKETKPEVAAAVPKDCGNVDLRVPADITHESRTVDDVFHQGRELGVKGQRSKGSKGSTSSDVSIDRSSRGSTKIDEVSEHKDDRHHKDEKHHIGDKLHGLKKKLSLKTSRRASSKENINENDGTVRETERKGSKKDKRFLSEKGRNGKGLIDEISVETGHRPKCPSPPHDRTSRELPKLPYESDPSILGPLTSARPLPERVFSVPGPSFESDSYESVDVHSREVRPVSVGDTDMHYEIVETKSKETNMLDVRPLSGLSQQYEAVDFRKLNGIAMQNLAPQDYRGDKYSEVPDSVCSSRTKNADHGSARSSTGSDLYAVVKDDRAQNPVPDFYAEVGKVEMGARMESNPTVAADLYAEPDTPLKRGDAATSTGEQARGQHIPAPPSVDTLRSLSESGRSLTSTDSTLSSASKADGSLVTVSQDHSKTTRVFHRETDPNKLEQMYSKINVSTKKRHSKIEIESSSSVVVEVVHHQDKCDDENDDGDDDSTPPPIPSSLYAPLPTGNEESHASSDGKEAVISQGETERRTSKTSLTYEEIQPTKSAETVQIEEKSVHSTDSVNLNDGLLTVNRATSVESNRLSTNSEAYEEISSLKRPGVDYKKEIETNGIDEIPVTGMVRISSYEDVGPKIDHKNVVGEHDGVDSSTVQPDRRSHENSFETIKSNKSEITNGNGEVMQTLNILPRNEEDNASGHYESLENLDFAAPSVPNDSNNSLSISSGLDSSVSNDPDNAVSLYEEVEVRKEEKKTKHSRFSGKKLKTLGHI